MPIDARTRRGGYSSNNAEERGCRLLKERDDRSREQISAGDRGRDSGEEKIFRRWKQRSVGELKKKKQNERKERKTECTTDFLILEEMAFLYRLIYERRLRSF